MSIYHITSWIEYEESYKKSIKDPEVFWEEIANENYIWENKWSQILNYDFNSAKIEWFKNAKLNITSNCLDRHLDTIGNEIAMIFEPNDPKEDSVKISYKELHKRVCKMANVLKNLGVKKGDRVCIYLPMILELPISVLACARIGAVHSVIFAGFSDIAVASRIQDCGAKIVICADGSYRGDKIIELKNIIDKAVSRCDNVEKVLIIQRTNKEINIDKSKDILFNDVYDIAPEKCKPEIMDAEDPLFILYTSGSTGKPKGMLHTTAGYMVYAGYTFQNVFNYKKGDIYWCTADIGWITGHTYLIYGPLLRCATTIIFEGIPSYPNFGRFWDIVEKHRVNQFYTAPTAIRALAKESLAWVKNKDLTSLKVIGTVGEPINEDAWNWYNTNIGNKKCPIVDTWWQTETGGIMISPIPFVTNTIPTYATLPLPGIKPILVNDDGEIIIKNEAEGKLCLDFPWPGMARSIWGDHPRFIDTYFSTFKGKYFSGDGALRDHKGNYRITGRVDDVVIVSGHNLGTAPIEDSINTHSAVAESAIVGFPHDIKGNALYGFVVLKNSKDQKTDLEVFQDINKHISDTIGKIAKLDKILFVSALPKTRSGKIMRRVLRKIASGEHQDFGDISTLLNPEIVEEIVLKSLKNIS